MRTNCKQEPSVAVAWQQPGVGGGGRAGTAAARLLGVKWGHWPTLPSAARPSLEQIRSSFSCLPAKGQALPPQLFPLPGLCLHDTQGSLPPPGICLMPPPERGYFYTDHSPDLFQSAEMHVGLWQKCLSNVQVVNLSASDRKRSKRRSVFISGFLTGVCEEYRLPCPARTSPGAHRASCKEAGPDFPQDGSRPLWWETASAPMPAT